MISRYTRPEMGILWTAESRFSYMMQVEIAAAQVQSKLKLIPRKAALEIAKKSKFNIRRIEEIEKSTKHDVIAFVSNLAENVGEHGKFIHFGLTSSDVLDTALSLQIRDAGTILLKSIDRLLIALNKISKKHQATLCAGRTHGMHAEPMSFGYKIQGFHSELIRNKERIFRALKQLEICKMSGAVGVYSSMGIDFEKRLAKQLKLKPEHIATQVVPRDRLAEIFYAFASYAAGIERLSVELRHLQRSEVGEVVEGFSKGQKGSSAMPHKKNPISAENMTGLSRILRSYVAPALENIVLWHERDISHSSVERVILPDAFILADYMAHRMETLISGLYVNEKKMSLNMALSQGQILSSQVLLALVKKGFSREESYSIVQRLCHSMGEGDSLEMMIQQDPFAQSVLSKKELSDIFSGKKLKLNFKQISKLKKRSLNA